MVSEPGQSASRLQSTLWLERGECRVSKVMDYVRVMDGGVTD